MHGQRRNGRKFCPEKVKYSKWEMLINILDIFWKIWMFGKKMISNPIFPSD